MITDFRVGRLLAVVRKRGLAALPKTYAVHWTPATKALVVEAVEGGWLMLDDALARYCLSLEEYRSWQAMSRGDLKVRREPQADVLHFPRLGASKKRRKRPPQA